MKENPKPCRKCGDLCRHDDDGDTICRFCEAAHETDGEPEAVTQWDYNDHPNE